MSRRLVPTLLLVGCSQTYLAPLQARVSATPSFADLGTLVLGGERIGLVRLGARDGNVQVDDVQVLPTEGEGFAFLGATPIHVASDETTTVDITFHPTQAGYASAVVRFATDAREGEIDVELRARAVPPALSATPFVLDLGVIPPGSSKVATVHLENTGDAAVVVDGAHAGDPAVTVDGAWPLTLAPGSGADVDVTAAPTDARILVTSLAFDVGTYAVGDLVLVRANDCAHGLPASYDVDDDGVTTCGGDCDDADPGVHPGAQERPNGVDDDCDDHVDEGTVRADDDGDGYCEDPTACEGGALPGDCVDADPAIAPDVAEYPGNGVDDDCDGLVDQGGEDQDHDGFGVGGGDCADGDPSRHPLAPEVANGVDDDCDGVIDEGTAAFDNDGDGWCASIVACVGGALTGDCDDAASGRHPGAAEVADFVDDDCDGRVDEGTSNGDDDGDGFTEAGGDCDDADPQVNPALGGCP